MFKRFLLLALLLMSCALCVAQKLTVDNFALDPTDLTASTQRRSDLNGDACALIKVQLAKPGAEFLGSVMGDTPYSKSEYFVYMMKGSKMLQVKLDGYLPIRVNFTDYGISGVESLSTYVLSITLPNVVGQMEDDGKTYFGISVTPKNASLRVDGELVALDDGQWLDKLDRGVHSYKIEAAGYESKEKTFTLGTERMNVEEVLVSTMATLTVKCPTAGADIYINEKKYGSNSAWTGTLVPRSYVIEARKEGYYTQQQSVELAAKQSRTVELPALIARVGQLDVAYKPLNSEVWIDGKKAGTSPDSFKNLTVGSHKVEIRKKGYQSETKIMTIAEGQTSTLNGSLTALTSSTSATTTSSTTSTSTESSTTQGKQTFTVINFALVPDDLTASVHQRIDSNGQACALVKVRLARPGATFQGNVMGDTPYSKSEYFVYMMKGSKMLQVKLDGYLPVLIDFTDYGYTGLESLSTYVLSITL